MLRFVQEGQWGITHVVRVREENGVRNAANETSRQLAPSVGHEEVDVIHAVVVNKEC